MQLLVAPPVHTSTWLRMAVAIEGLASAGCGFGGHTVMICSLATLPPFPLQVAEVERLSLAADPPPTGSEAALLLAGFRAYGYSVTGAWLGRFGGQAVTMGGSGGSADAGEWRTAAP